MTKITLLTVGKLKEDFYRRAAAEYQKRLSRYCRLEIIEGAEEKTPDGAGAAEEEAVRRKEGERLKKYIRDGAYVVTLEIEGKMLDSEEFARRLDRLAVPGKSHLIFIIGGSLGLSDEICRKSDFALSFSRMTFPHQLMRVILLEQIYRGYRILSGEPYHK